MYSILIAEDNPRERREICRILAERSTRAAVEAVCTSGVDALELTERAAPDILISDIVMPKMNGLRLAEEVRKRHPQTRIIFTSCHDDFGYAKTAIDLRAYSYILKPIQERELIDAVTEAVRALDEERTKAREREELVARARESLPVLRERFLRELLFYPSPSEEVIAGKLDFLEVERPEVCSLQVMSVLLDGPEQEDEGWSVDERYITGFSIGRTVTEHCDTSAYLYTVPLSDAEFAVLLFSATERAREEQRTTTDMLIDIKNKIDENLDIVTRAGISRTSRAYTDIRSLYREAVNARDTRFVGDRDGVVLAEDVDETQCARFEETVDLSEMLRSIRGLLEVCDGETVVSFLETYLPGSTQYDKRYVQSVAYSIVNLLQIVLTEQNLEPSRVIGRLGRLQYKLDKCSRIHDVRRLLHAVMDDSIAYVARTHADARERIVADIKNVIARRYREHVTVSDIAESVSYSASQANVIFKSATGRTIFDHLSAFRIEKAKELLRDPYSRIYLVAEEVGYRNKSHFCLQFKKATGLTPQQYKSRARE